MGDQTPAFLQGGGEMGALMRSMDWSQTPLGPPSTWPQSLRTTVSTCLNSRFPILIWWGPQFVKLYNDAYRQIISGKHPFAMGAPGRKVWPEIWHIIGPMLEGVVSRGSATWSEDQFLPLERHGYAEECYFTFSYSPIHDESGGVGGVFCAVTETTGRVIGERRLRLLQELASAATAPTTDDACRRAMTVLESDRADVPFALVYLLDTAQATLRLSGATGIDADASLAPPVWTVRSFASNDSVWPFDEVLESGAIRIVDSPGGPARRAFVMRLSRTDGSPEGVLVAGVSPNLEIDDQYRGFAALLARQIGGSIAQARALEDEKRRAEALAEIDRAKTTFFSNVSHEFRTPLTLMLSPIEEAIASDDRALKGDDLLTVHRNARRLLKLVNTLLDFSRIEAGRARAAFEPTDLAQLTADLASAFRSAVASAGLRFEVDCPPLSAPVYVDRDMWEQIVLNLVSNALKFTFAGTIAVSLCERDERVELRVRDTGVGIAEQELPRVFERFHRMHGAASRTHEGSGIGLALVSELVRMHGGTIEVASRPGEGTTFTVSLPTGTAHLPPDAVRPPRAGVSSAQAQAYVEEALRWLPDAAAEPAAGPTRKPAAHGDAPVRILLVDDNADMREYVARLLADRWTVETAADGHVALQSVRARPPSLIVSDIMMPRVDGFELIRQLRADPDTRDLPVILLSARAGEEASIEALAAGADDYVVKPFSARDLRARVEAQLLRAQIHAIQVAHDRRLADIFRHAPVAIAILRGPDHVYEFTNEPYLALIGHRAVRGKPIREALPELADQGVFQLLDNVYQTGVPYTAESLRVALNRRPDGGSEDVFFTFVYQPMRGRDGRVDGIAVVALDVTDLARARREAEAANAAKDDFLATLGHELRNPIAPILTAVRLLELQGPADERLQRLRETIFRQTVHLAKLVDDLLDVGRIITGKLALKKERVELNALVSQAAEACAPFVQRRRHTLHVTPSPTPVCLEADGARIVQIVSNLLNNAAKFMPTPGRIDVSVSVDAADAVVRVRDEGVGIDPGMRDRIFERFVQVDSTAGLEGGLGIGLSLVKAMVDLHGGTVAVHSEGPGKGSEFVVRLPAIAAPTPPAAA